MLKFIRDKGQIEKVTCMILLEDVSMFLVDYTNAADDNAISGQEPSDQLIFLRFFFPAPLLTWTFQGASTTCYAALHPQVKGISGAYFRNNNIAKASSKAMDADFASRLWEFSLNLAKQNGDDS